MGDEKKREGAGMSRRTFALGVGGAGVLLAMGGLKLVPAEAQVRPPGGQDESRLVASCIRCERCVEACPRGALRPAHIEDGIVSVRTPTTNFNDGWCDFCADENDGVPLCVAACPTEALALPPTRPPKPPSSARPCSFANGAWPGTRTTAAGSATTRAPTRPSSWTRTCARSSYPTTATGAVPAKACACPRKRAPTPPAPPRAPSSSFPRARPKESS